VPLAGDAPRSGASCGTRNGEVFPLVDDHAAPAIADVFIQARRAGSCPVFLHSSNDQHGLVCEHALRFTHKTEFRDRN